jgi:hypothetical protein
VGVGVGVGAGVGLGIAVGAGPGALDGAVTVGAAVQPATARMPAPAIRAITATDVGILVTSAAYAHVRPA